MSRRVLLYAHNLAISNPTGIHRYCVDLVSAMAGARRTDLAFEVWTGRRAGSGGGDLGVGVRQVPVDRRLLHLAWGAVAAPRLERLTGPADLVHQLLPAFPVPSQAPLVATVHDLLPVQHPEWYRRKERWGFGRAMRMIQQRASKIVVLSDWVARDLVGTLAIEPDRIAVVPGGIHGGFTGPVATDRVAVACRRAGVEPGEFVLSVGAVEPRKNLTTVIEAVASSQRHGRGLRLVVVGADGHDAAQVRAVPQALGAGDAVRFLGRVDDTELRALMAGAVALTHPSWYEGFGFPPLEAMAAGTPVVASNAGSLPEVVGDAGILLPPDDPSAWAGALGRLAGDPQLRESMVAAGRRRAAQFSWEAAAAKTIAVYDAVLGDASSSPAGPAASSR